MQLVYMSHSLFVSYCNLILFSLDLHSKSKNQIHLTFDHNFSKCRPIYKILSLSNSRGNIVHKYYEDYPPHHKCFYTTLWNLKITIAANFNGILHVRPQNSSCKKEATSIAQVWSYDCKIWKTMQQCSEDDSWCQRTEAVDEWHVTWAAADSHWWSLH